MTATVTATPAHPTDLSNIYRLADQLDATLAMGEDLLGSNLVLKPLMAGDANAALARRHQQISDFARHLRALELAMTARLLQARARAADVRDVHPRFTPLIGLFVGGTAPLTDAATSGGLGDISELALATGPDVLAFLKSRALIDADAASLGSCVSVQVTDGYLLAAAIHLGTLLDMIAQFLDSLDLAFDLYDAAR